MSWKTIRLELGPIPGFPRGSASRAFVLCAPLDRHGYIDRDAVARDPRRATVRRFWASEADQFGRLSNRDGMWACQRIGKESDADYRFVAGPFVLGATLHVERADGTRLPFRVTKSGKLTTFGIAAE